MHSKKLLPKIYERLFSSFGPQSWWPGETKFEIIVGAILTQNTNWKNVEYAISNLKANHLLTPRALKEIPIKKLASLIKPAGYFNVKARRLKNFIHFLFEKYQGKIEVMEKEETVNLRRDLLSVHGIGPETADSILLYALNKPIFVIDAYTKRMMHRHHIMPSDVDYHDLQKLFHNSLKEDRQLFNEYHALIVHVGKNFCKTKPRCEICPLKDLLPRKLNFT